MSLSERVLRWKAAWEDSDPDRVAALYAMDATHASAAVGVLLPDLNRTEIRGPAELRQYASVANSRVLNRQFEILQVTTVGGRDVVEYLRRSSIDIAGPKHVIEVLEWEGDLLSAVRVFHF